MDCVEKEKESAKRFNLAMLQLRHIYNSDGSKALFLHELTQEEIEKIRVKSYLYIK